MTVPPIIPADMVRTTVRQVPDGTTAARTTSSTRRRARSSAGSGESPAEVRAWAEANGIKVNARGRIPADVLAAYRAAH